MENDLNNRFYRYLKSISSRKKRKTVFNRKKVKKTILYFFKELNYNIDMENLFESLMIIFDLRIIGLYKEIAKVQILESEFEHPIRSWVGDYLYYLYERQFSRNKKMERCFLSNESFVRMINFHEKFNTRIIEEK